MMPTPIEERRLLLVEGRDEEEFFKALLNHMGVTHIQVLNYEGRYKLRQRFPAIARTPGFDSVSRLAITRDADKDAGSAFQSIQDLLRDLEMPFPDTVAEFTSKTEPLVGVFVLPGQERPGMLEDLCLETVGKHPVLECVGSYMQCLSERVHDRALLPHNKSKARAHAFLAGMPKLVNNVGLAAHRRYWDLDAAVLRHLRAFLNALGN